MTSTRSEAYESVSIKRFGNEGEPIVIIDGFYSDPDALVRQSAASGFGPAGRHYPGQRAPAPSAYLAERMNLLKDLLTDVFDAGKGAALVECNFSVVTTRPEALTPIQRLPHFDSTDKSNLALLHYLCPADAGGTSFYRHCATGYETVTEDRLQPYTASLQAEATREGLPPAAYFSGSTHQFERIGGVEAAFNRMVIYRGYRLHSGDVLKPEQIGQPGADPRLTVNTFLKVRT